jgi:hypothetical protein
MRIFLTALILLSACVSLSADDSGALVVQTCGTLPQPYAVGSTRQITVDTTGQLCAV